MRPVVAQVFSGIQPSGVPHLGNYFGAIAQWIQVASTQQVQVDAKAAAHLKSQQRRSSHEAKDGKQLEEKTSDDRRIILPCNKPIYSIVDVHAYSSRKTKSSERFYSDLLSTTAALLALGLDTSKCILFRQSDVLEHNYLDNVLDNFVSPNRLLSMTQYKDKLNDPHHAKNITNGLLTYPVLQAADVLLYKANVVPVGEDQTQHVELIRDIARKFNSSLGHPFFPEPATLLTPNIHARRIKSLRNPDVKMSKSDPNSRAYVQVIDEPEIIIDKLKKAVTDTISAVYYDAERRPGVSNLMRIHHGLTGESFECIEKQNGGVETANYKLKLADMLIEKFRATRQEYRRLMNDPAHLELVLSGGKNEATQIAKETIASVRQLLGSISRNQ